MVKVLTVAAILSMALSGCDSTMRNAGSLLPNTLQLREGDVVLRRGTGLTSRLVISQDREGFFSHVGIVVDSAHTPMIVHAVPGEPDFPGDPDRVKMTSPHDFFDKKHAVAAAVYRPREAEVGKRAADVALEVYRRGTLFDHDFNEEDTSQMYCTELITHVYRHAGIELVDDRRHVVDLPAFHYRCILPSQLCNSPYLRNIYMFNP
ncbi:MAG: hypothetical protein K2O17_01430 [Bacteroidaceae bacterium]|nr:hypothetical protein [Bacteroidaceae bacterium]